MTDVFRDDRDLLTREFVDQEHALARELASVRQLLHLALGQMHEKDQRHHRLVDQHRHLLAEYRHLRETILRDDRSRAA